MDSARAPYTTSQYVLSWVTSRAHQASSKCILVSSLLGIWSGLLFCCGSGELCDQRNLGGRNSSLQVTRLGSKQSIPQGSQGRAEAQAMEECGCLASFQTAQLVFLNNPRPSSQIQRAYSVLGLPTSIINQDHFLQMWPQASLGNYTTEVSFSQVTLGSVTLTLKTSQHSTAYLPCGLLCAWCQYKARDAELPVAPQDLICPSGCEM